jgi:hypothetical protein
MTEAHSRRGPLSTIRGWMIAIAVIGVTMGSMVVSPFVFVLVVFVLLEAVAAIRYRESRRRKPMAAWVLAIWIFAFFVVIPIMSVVVAFTALYAYCAMNPNAFQ